MSRPSITTPPCCADRALTGDEDFAHLRQARHRGRDLVDLGRPDRARDVVTVDGDDSAFDDEIRGTREIGDRRFVVQRDAVVMRLPSDRAIHRAGVDVAITKRLRQRT